MALAPATIVTPRRQQLDDGWRRLYDSYLTHTCELQTGQGFDEIGRRIGTGAPKEISCFINRTRQRIQTPTQNQEQYIWVVDIPQSSPVKPGDYLRNGKDKDGSLLFRKVRVNSVDYTLSAQSGLFIQSARCTDG